MLVCIPCTNLSTAAYFKAWGIYMRLGHFSHLYVAIGTICARNPVVPSIPTSHRPDFFKKFSGFSPSRFEPQYLDRDKTQTKDFRAVSKHFQKLMSRAL